MLDVKIQKVQKYTPTFHIITRSKVCMIRSVRERRNNRWWLVTVLAYAAMLAYTGHTGLYISVAYTLA